MQVSKKKLSESDVLLCGLRFTSRTETLEDYLKDKVKSLTVIAISSCFLRENLSCCKVYRQGRVNREFRIPNFRIKDYRWYRQPLVLLVFVVNWFSVCYCLFMLKKKYDLYFGISHSFALWGAILKKIGVVKNLIYYCIDYYLPDEKLNFNSLFVRFLNILDRFTVKTADYIWDLSPRISEYREKKGKIKTASYQNTIVPLGYSRHLRRFKPFAEIRRWDIGFVGSISPNQGLQLLVEVMPQIIKDFPQITATIIGQGPYLNELKELVKREGLESYFNFLGFIKNEEEMLNILSLSAISLALYTDSGGNQACADTGKPKLYALIGLPIVTTKAYILHQEVSRSNSGIVINYNKNDLKSAINYLMENDDRLKEFREKSYQFGGNFISDVIFDEAIRKIGLN